MADLSGRTCVVTGATSGIGEETARALLGSGARVVMVGRDPERGAASLERLRGEGAGERAELVLADLSRQAEVHRLADELMARCPEIHVLVNNAGVVMLERRTTDDGFETTFAVNHLAYHTLTLLLLPRLRESAPSRIVNVASDAHKFGHLDLDDLQSERRYRAMRVYGTSKLANILFTRELARRLEGSGVSVNSVHPGAVATRLGKNNGWFGRVVTTLLSPFFLSPARGARTTIHVATAPELDGVSGRYFVKSRETEPTPQARDDDLARGLWAASARLTGVDL